VGVMGLSNEDVKGMYTMKSNTKLSSEQREELLGTLKARFEK
jgi:hypothetical protein